MIGTPSGLGALLFSDPTFASRVTRNPTAAQVNAAIANTVPFFYTFAAVPRDRQHPRPAAGQFRRPQTNGLDFDVRYRRTRLRDDLRRHRGQLYLQLRNQLSPTSAESDSLQAGVPRTTLRTTLGFTAGPVTFVNFVNHRSGVTAPTRLRPARPLQANGYTTVDLRLSVTPAGRRLREGARSSALQVNDVFDATPPSSPAPMASAAPTIRSGACGGEPADRLLTCAPAAPSRRPRTAAHHRPRFAIR